MKQAPPTLQHAPLVRRVIGRVGRHVGWARTQGIGRLIEEDELDPIARLKVSLRRRQWRRANPVRPGSATPVYLVGVQRSGTNMVVRGLEQSPEFEVHNESDRRAFSRFLLKPDDDVRALIDKSPHRFVLLKPLCDSHRVDHLLDGLGTAQPGKAIWAYRNVDGRARSAVAKFGDANLQVLSAIAAGTADDRWQAQRLSPRSLELIRSLDVPSLSVHSAAALFWFVRNSLFFDLGLDTRSDVLLVSYDRFVSDPTSSMRSLAAFLGIGFDQALVAHVDPRSAQTPPLEIDARVRTHCDELEHRLAGVIATRPTVNP